VDGASFIIQNCVFPTATAQFELVHGTGGVRSDGHGVFLRNWFGVPIAYNDVIDFTGGNRPAPIVHFIDNVFTGASDDILDLDGTDAWVEGNIFMHAHRNGSPDSSSAISGGNDPASDTTPNNTSEITIIGNLIYDCDMAVNAKQWNFYTLLNNTIVRMTKQGGANPDSAVALVADVNTHEGSGMYFEGNIIYDVENLVLGRTNAIMTFTNNILFAVATNNYPPSTNAVFNNETNNPLFKSPPMLAQTFGFTNWASAQVLRDWFSLLSNSPAVGTGPNGTDKGGIVPIGASISGAPVGATSQSNATLVVGINRSGNGIPNTANAFPLGSGYTHYKWRLDGGAWSAETPIATAIVLSNLVSGPHYVEVSGKRDSALYQDSTLFGPVAQTTRTATWFVGGGDSDGDGLPDSWEIQYFMNLAQGPNGDPDGDGMTNLQEYLAGTDPTNAASKLALSISSPSGNAVTLQFNAVSNKTYTLLYRTSLSTGGWLRLKDFPSASVNGTNTVTTNLTGATKFFEVQTPQAP
jgi:hypothetical protein